MLRPMLAAAAASVPPVQYFQSALQVELAVFIALAFQVRIYAAMELNLGSVVRGCLGVTLVLQAATSLGAILAALHAIAHGGSEITKFLVNSGLAVSLGLLVAQLIYPMVLGVDSPRAWRHVMWLLLVVSMAIAVPWSLR